MLKLKDKDMLDTQEDTEDQIQIISNKLKSVTTIEPVAGISKEVKTLKMSNSASCFLSDDKSFVCSDDNGKLVRNLPAINLPEKILFVIDTTRERNCTPFKLSSGAKYMPLFMIKRVVESFVCIKSAIQRSHEYALMILNSQGAQWICDFTNNIKSIVNHLDIIDEDILQEDNKSYDLGQLFEKVELKLSSSTNKQNTLTPTFVTRMILIYSQSNSVPKFHTGRKFLDDLTKNPYFFIDILYVHEPPCSENSCQEIYAEIAALDRSNLSYIFEVGRNAAKLHDNMAKLLAHPLQRPLQTDICYTTYPTVSLQEIHTNV